jgi:hypothetical protein
MSTFQPVERREAAARSASKRCLAWLTTNLLIAYLAAITAQHLWSLLNSDVRELARRLP